MNNVLQMQLGTLLVSYILLFSHYALSKPSTFNVEPVGQGQAMILLPDINSPAEAWQSIIEEFQSEFQVHFISVKGFAGVPLETEASTSQLVSDLSHYINTHQLDRPIIIGHGYGAIVGFMLAIDKPDLYSSMVVIDAVPFYPHILNPNMTPETMKIPAERMRQQLRESNHDIRLEYYKDNSKTLVSGKKNQKRLTDWSTASDPSMTAEAHATIMINDFRQDIAQIKIPTLILGSCALAKMRGGSQAMMKEVYKKQYKAMPNKEILIHREAMHFMMLDAPKWVNSRIRKFLNKQK